MAAASQISLNPSSPSDSSYYSQTVAHSPQPVIENPIFSGSNYSHATQLIQPAPTIETLQIPEIKDRNADIEKGAPDDLQYKYLVKRFNFKVVLSTFACALVVAYLTFINNVARAVGSIDRAHGIPFNVLMLLAYLSICLHASSTIVASRGAVLCSDPELIKEKKYEVEDFKYILALCQHLNLHGIILFALAVLGSSFFVFEDYVYPAVFCGFSIVVVVLLFVGKYRRLSLIHRELTQVWEGITKALWSGRK